MHICLFNLSKYEVSLFRLYIAFLTITASSSHNKNNDYDNFRDIWSFWLLILRNQTTVRNQIDFVKINVIEIFFYDITFFFFSSVALKLIILF